MSIYYLISQLPSLDAVSENAPLPITEERFLKLCGEFLDKRSVSKLLRLTLLPPKEAEKSGSVLVDAFNEGERNLRFALEAVRAQKRGKPIDKNPQKLSSKALSAAQMATEFESPMEAELYLNHYRLGFLEALRPMDAFAEDSVYYYGLKLKLISRITQFDKISGEAAYKNIYSSIMNGDGLEVE